MFNQLELVKWNRFHYLRFQSAFIKNPLCLVIKQSHNISEVYRECNFQPQMIVESLCLLPGHGTLSLQTLESLGSPSHFFPPCWGAGELHSRVLDCFPCWHVFVHVLHSPHSPQFPLTEIKLSFSNFFWQTRKSTMCDIVIIRICFLYRIKIVRLITSWLKISFW